MRHLWRTAFLMFGQFPERCVVVFHRHAGAEICPVLLFSFIRMRGQEFDVIPVRSDLYLIPFFPAKLVEMLLRDEYPASFAYPLDSNHLTHHRPPSMEMINYHVFCLKYTAPFNCTVFDKVLSCRCVASLFWEGYTMIAQKARGAFLVDFAGCNGKNEGDNLSLRCFNGVLPVSPDRSARLI